MDTSEDMREFRFTANFTFQASDIDNAFIRLSKHFRALAKGEDSDLITLGEAHIEPVNREDWVKADG